MNNVQKTFKLKKHEVAINLPTIATYNVRSLFPKLNSFKTDMIERAVQVAFISEVWEQKENEEHSNAIEEMLEIDGLHYISKSRPSTNRGGGVAIIVNSEKFRLEKLDIQVPNKLEVIWCLVW